MKSDKVRIMLCWLGAALCAAIGVVGGSLLGGSLLRSGKASLLLLYSLNAVQQGFAFALPALLILQARTARWARFRQACRPVPMDTAAFSLLLAVGGAVAASVIASLWAQWLYSVTGYQGSADPLPTARNAAEWGLALLAVALIPALCEELFFRALIQGALCRRMPRAGVWLAAAVFAALHFRWEALPALLLIGVVLGKTYLRRGYWGSVLVHALYNAVVLVLSGRDVAISVGTAAVCFAACWLALRGVLKGEDGIETDGIGM